MNSNCPGISDKELWWIHGNGYDLNPFVERHPGGLEAILLGKGRDCTALVESYHAFSSQHSTILEKYLVKTVNANPSRDHFYDILKQRAAEALQAQGIDPVKDRGAGWLRTLYYAFIVAMVFVTGYFHAKVRSGISSSCITFSVCGMRQFEGAFRNCCISCSGLLYRGFQGSVLGSFAFAVFGWLMGSLGHDAGHFAASHVYPQLNEWGVWAMALICNPVMWQQQHTYGHHSFTNEVSHDPDVHHFDRLLRVHKGVPYDRKYQSQKYWLYVALAYSFVVFGTAFYIPITMIQNGSLYGVVDWHDKDRPSKAIGMRLHTLCYFLIVMVVPFFSHESKWTAMGAVSLHISTLGILFAIFSQINHLNEPSLEADMETRQRESKSRDPRIVNSWAAAQVETSNNFASQSWVWHLLSNGLNHQIEHHLFPGLNHAHLHHIAPVVRQTCEEFGVIYKSYETWSDIMTATLQWYCQMSVDPYENASSQSE